MRLRHIIPAIAVVGICSFVFNTNVYADPCSNLNKNEKWNKLSSTLESNIDHEEYYSALETIASMKEICSRSPMLNYSAGVVYRKLGDDTKALYYLQQATLNTEEFSVTGTMLEQIWFERYEAEHPQATQGSIESYQTQIQTQKDLNTKLMANIQTLEADRLHSEYTNIWTGVGIASAGVIMAVAGGVVIGVIDNPVSVSSGNHITYNQTRDLGWAFVGAGIGLGIAGSIVAGIAGYRYHQIKETSHEHAVFMELNSSGLNMRF